MATTAAHPFWTVVNRVRAAVANGGACAVRRDAQPPLSGAERAAVVERLQRLARLLDSAVVVPGTKFRVGLDPVLGLIPGLGDVVSAACSVYILYEAKRLGVSRAVQAKMLANIAADLAVGAIPLVGDLCDFAFKANLRNLRLMGIETGCPPARKRV
jgi:hypothetical protein